MKNPTERNRQNGFLFLAATWFIVCISVSLDWSNIRFQYIFWANMVTPMSMQYFTGLLLLAIDFILLMAGSYIILREGKPNLCLTMAFLIGAFEITVKGNHIVSLLSAYSSCDINFGYYGIGLNIVGVGLLIGYLRLKALL